MHRDLADKVLEAERSLVELAKEMGISVEALRKWSVMVERAHDTDLGSITVRGRLDPLLRSG